MSDGDTPMEFCPDCRGQGYFDCDTCDGDPPSIGGCPVCFEDGTYKCDNCDGLGVIEKAPVEERSSDGDKARRAS